MNRIILIGRLTKNPDLRYTPAGAAVCTFTLAVDRPFTNQSGEREADFVNIVVWNKQGENAAKYLTKGRQAAVEGRLQIRSYEGNDGQRRWVTEVIADRVEYIGGQNQGQEGQNNRPQAGVENDPDGQFGRGVVYDDNGCPF